MLADHVIFAVLSNSLRFFDEVSYTSDNEAMADLYSREAWRLVLSKSFEDTSSLDHRLVQSATLLAIYDFTGETIGLVIASTKTDNNSLQASGIMDQDRAYWQASTNAPDDV